MYTGEPVVGQQLIFTPTCLSCVTSFSLAQLGKPVRFVLNVTLGWKHLQGYLLVYICSAVFVSYAESDYYHWYASGISNYQLSIVIYMSEGWFSWLLYHYRQTIRNIYT